MTSLSPVAAPLPLPVLLKPERMHLLAVGSGTGNALFIKWILGQYPAIQVTVVDTTIQQSLAAWVQDYPKVQLAERAYDCRDMTGKQMVICAVEDARLQDKIYRDARAKGVWIYRPGDPLHSDFSFAPAVAATDSKDPFDQFTGIEEPGNRWRKITWWSLFAFAFMLIGYFLFTYMPFRSMADQTANWYQSLDQTFLIMMLAGFAAQLVDGALGMGYGVTSATILLSAGVNPAAISGSIHTAEMFASGASGYSHYKFGNVNMKLFKALLLPGVLGAIAGAVLLVLAGERYGAYIRPAIAIYTLFLGIKFIVNAFREMKPRKKFRHYRALAGIGGFFDSFGGGGWGPIVTSTLINNGRSHKYVVGSVSLTEFFVTLASAFTFFTMIGVSHWQTIIGLIIGGLVAAPLAARLAGKLPRKTAYLLLGLLVIGWSIRILVKLL